MKLLLPFHVHVNHHLSQNNLTVMPSFGYMIALMLLKLYTELQEIPDSKGCHVYTKELMLMIVLCKG